MIQQPLYQAKVFCRDYAVGLMINGLKVDIFLGIIVEFSMSITPCTISQKNKINLHLL